MSLPLQPLNRQISTDPLLLSPYINNIQPLSHQLSSPQMSNIPNLGQSTQYINQLQSPQCNIIQPLHSHNNNNNTIQNIELTSPAIPIQQHNYYNRSQQHQYIQPIHPIQPIHNQSNIRVRSIDDRLIIKLTSKLINTYHQVNDMYYANKQKEKEKKIQLQQQQQQSQTHDITTNTVTTNTTTTTYNPNIKRSGVHNNGCDDKDYNYIVIPQERIGPTDRYIVEHSIGKGSFGRVVKCFDRHTQEWVAVKIVKSKSAFFRQAQVEINILKLLCGNKQDSDKYNIVHMLDYFIHQNHQCIVFELLSLNLYELLRNTRFNGVSLKLVGKFAQQLLYTLHYLTNVNTSTANSSTTTTDSHHCVIHCDLKPENILLRTMTKSSIKVIDFGSACLLHEKSFTYIQSRFYRSPEVILGISYNECIDMFSRGCMILHCGLCN